MLRRVFALALAAGFLSLAAAPLSAQTAAQTATQPAAPTATHREKTAARRAESRAPRTAAELTQDLSASLRKGPLTSDAIDASVSGDVITLTGHVHWAEHKGLATRAAREVARKDGWTSFHVANKIEVE